MTKRGLALVLALTCACTAKVQINSNPSGARVWVDGKELGTTPATTTVDYSAFSKHSIRIEAPGYETYSGAMRTELNPGPLLAALLCPCFLPALCWVSMPSGNQVYELVPVGGAPLAPIATPAPLEIPKAEGDYTFTIVPGVPAVGAPKFFPAMESAAQEKKLSAWRAPDAIQIEPEPKVVLRYRIAGDAIILEATIGAEHRPVVAQKEAMVRALHDELLASATRFAERAKAFEAKPTPLPTQEPQPIATPAPIPAKTPKKPKVDLDRDAREKRCASGIDCGPGEFCKDRGDGLKLCMGNNVRGEFCASGIDCAPSLFCKDRGDGLKVCMGNGRRGDPCVSGVDCEGTMRCKDAGDGFKTCM